MEFESFIRMTHASPPVRAGAIARGFCRRAGLCKARHETLSVPQRARRVRQRVQGPAYRRSSGTAPPLRGVRICHLSPVTCYLSPTSYPLRSLR